MKIRAVRRLAVGSTLAALLVVIAACSSNPQASDGETSSAFSIPSTEPAPGSAAVVDGVVDLGCSSEVEACPIDDAPPPTEPIATAAPSDFSDMPAGGGIHFLADPPKTWTQTCIDTLTATTAAGVNAVKVCSYTIAVCAALIGNANGTEIQKFCAAAAKVANCKGKANAEKEKVQSTVCSSCSTIAACADGGTKK